jgi:hypothetical protein
MGPSYSFRTEPPWDHLIHSEQNLHGTILFIQNRTSMGPSYSFRTEPPWDHLIHSEQNLHGTILFIQNRTSMGPSYSFRTEPPWDHLIHSEQTGVWFIQVKLAKILCIGTLFIVWFMQDSGLFQI